MKTRRISAYVIPMLLALPAGCGTDDGPGGPAEGPLTVVLAVDSSPTGAEIFVDGTDTGSSTPDTLLISAGTHVVALRLCDYEEWTKTYEALDGDTLSPMVTLDKRFSFLDDFEAGGGNWTAGCPFSFPDTGSHDGSAYALIIGDDDCSTRLLTELDVPQCLVPRVSFYYRLTSPGLVACNLRVDAGGRSEIVAVDTTTAWTRFDVPSSTFDGLSGPTTFTFALSGNGVNAYRLSLDDFTLDAQ